MIDTKEAFFANLNAPQVIEERNKLVAARFGKDLGYGSEKMQKLFGEVSRLSAEPRRLIETLYVQLWPKKQLCRNDIQSIINKCHEEALVWFQMTYPDLLVG